MGDLGAVGSEFNISLGRSWTFCESKMSADDESDGALHHAGATVLHQSPFAHLTVPESVPPTQEFADKWVIPFYNPRTIRNHEKFAHALSPMFSEVDDALITRLLSEFNWRPRIVGAWFAAIRHRKVHEDLIGTLLLRSDVCFSGCGYCVALAKFNSAASHSYLSQYLKYYLTRRDLHYDQPFAMGAIAHLDSVNGTNDFDSLLPAWKSYVGARDSSLDRMIELVNEQMNKIDAIAAAVAEP